jgi:hypothetical protein
VVDGHPLSDDLLGVVGTTLDLGALEQPAHDGVVVDGELEHVVERAPWALSMASSASTWARVRG